MLVCHIACYLYIHIMCTNNVYILQYLIHIKPFSAFYIYKTTFCCIYIYIYIYIYKAESGFIWISYCSFISYEAPNIVKRVQSKTSMKPLHQVTNPTKILIASSLLAQHYFILSLSFSLYQLYKNFKTLYFTQISFNRL